MAIGRNVAALIRDGSTLQMGIGAVPNAVLQCLTDHRDLGVHTEMFTDGLLPLLRSGVVNGARKNVNPGRVVTAFSVGSRALYDFVDGNPMVEYRPVDYTNNVAVIASHDNMVAINSALSVDLTGQVSPIASALASTAASADRSISSVARRNRAAECPSSRSHRRHRAAGLPASAPNC